MLIAGIVLRRAGRLGGVAVPARVRPRARRLPQRRLVRPGTGYLTLDIRRYTDVGLSFVLPVVFLLLGGIPLPGGAVLDQPRGDPVPRGARSLVSLAGPR